MAVSSSGSGSGDGNEGWDGWVGVMMGTVMSVLCAAYDIFGDEFFKIGGVGQW